MAGRVVQVDLRLPADVLERVDAAVGPLGSRNAWLVAAVVEALPVVVDQASPDGRGGGS